MLILASCLPPPYRRGTLTSPTNGRIDQHIKQVRQTSDLAAEFSFRAGQTDRRRAAEGGIKL